MTKFGIPPKALKRRNIHVSRRKTKEPIHPADPRRFGRGASSKVFDEGFQGFGDGENIGSIRSAGPSSEPIVQTPSGSQVGGPNNGRRNSGILRSDNATR